MPMASAVVRKAPSPRLTGTNPLGTLLTVAQEPRLGPQPNSLDNAVANATHWVQLSNAARRPDAMWLEAGAMMQRRGTEDPSGLGVYPNWAWSWPANRRVLYNRASCDPVAAPKLPSGMLLSTFA